MSFLGFIFFIYCTIITSGVGHRYVEFVKDQALSMPTHKVRFNYQWAIIESAKLPYYIYLAFSRNVK